MPKVSETYKEMKRKEIMEHALLCFADKGFHNTTIDDIVHRSGVSKGAIYGYFTSKEEMYIQLLQTGTEQMFERLKESFSGKSAADKIRTIIRQYREKVLTYHWVSTGRVHMEFWLNSARSEEMKKIMISRYESYIQLLEEIIDEGKATGEFTGVDSRRAASLFWAMADGIFLRVSVIADQKLYTELWDDAEEAFLRYLSARI